MKNLIEYSWNEITERGDFTYEDADGVQTLETKAQPLKVIKPTIEHYWGELIWYLKTQPLTGGYV